MMVQLVEKQLDYISTRLGYETYIFEKGGKLWASRSLPGNELKSKAIFDDLASRVCKNGKSWQNTRLKSLSGDDDGKWLWLSRTSSGGDSFIFLFCRSDQPPLESHRKKRSNANSSDRILESDDSHGLLQDSVDLLGEIINAGIHADTERTLNENSLTQMYQELGQANARLRQANEGLREVDRLKSAFLATVTHELRTPLTSVIGYADLIRQGIAGPVSDGVLDYTHIIASKGRELLSMISQILDLSALDHSEGIVRSDAIDLNACVHEALSSVVPQADSKNVQIETKLEHELPLLSGHQQQMCRMLTNLVGNAVKFSEDNGRVSVQTCKVLKPRLLKYSDEFKMKDLGELLFLPPTSPYAQISVVDTGIGIPDEKLQTIFEPFVQADDSITRRFGGSGLGLSIVKGIVERHGGSIDVESEQGHGTTFRVTLPLPMV